MKTVGDIPPTVILARVRSSEEVHMARLAAGFAGNAGVMFVAAELCRRGLIALPTARNTEGVDLVVSEPMGGKAVSIQVKTSQASIKKWLLSKKHESIASPNLFYVFVNLGSPGEVPEYHVVPSRVVARTIARGHVNWLATLGRGGQSHNDTSLRAFWDFEAKYRDNWAILGLKLVE
jgi:hypothetical protein